MVLVMPLCCNVTGFPGHQRPLANTFLTAVVHQAYTAVHAGNGQMKQRNKSSLKKCKLLFLSVGS